MCPWISRRKKDRHVCRRRVGKNCGTNLQSNCRMYAVKGALRRVSFSYRYWRHSRKIRSAIVCRIVEMRLVPKIIWTKTRVNSPLSYHTRAWSSCCLPMTVDDDDWLLKRSLRVSLALWICTCVVDVMCGLCVVFCVVAMWSAFSRQLRVILLWLRRWNFDSKKEGNLVKPNLILLTTVFKLLNNNKIIKEVQ